MIEIRLSSNANEVVASFNRIGKNLVNYAPVLKSSGEFMLKSIQTNFLAQGRPTPWAPLSPMTLMMRTKGRGSGSPKILMDTGNLFRSLTYQVGDSSVQIGTNIKYAKKLNFGGVNKMPALVQKIPAHYRKYKGKRVKVNAFERHQPARTFVVPERKFMMFQSEDVESLQGIFQRWVAKSVKEGTK